MYHIKNYKLKFNILGMKFKGTLNFQGYNFLKKDKLAEVLEDKETLKRLGIAGKIGIVYLGLRAMGRFAGIGPEIEPKEICIVDAIGVSSAYIGGCCLGLSKFLELTYQKTLERNCKTGLDQI